MPKRTPVDPAPVPPADTIDPTVEVSTITPRPSGSDLTTGTTPGATESARLPAFVEPLHLADEPRIEQYELAAPDGTIVEVTKNIDTGQMDHRWTTRRAWPLPVDVQTTSDRS